MINASICLLKMLIWGFEFNSEKGCSSVNDALIKRIFFPQIDVFIEDDASNSY